MINEKYISDQLEELINEQLERYNLNDQLNRYNISLDRYVFTKIREIFDNNTPSLNDLLPRIADKFVINWPEKYDEEIYDMTVNTLIKFILEAIKNT